jgi:hypothetical protein
MNLLGTEEERGILMGVCGPRETDGERVRWRERHSMPHYVGGE